MSILDIGIIIISVLVGFNLKHLYPSFSQAEKKWLNGLFLYHLAIAVAFSIYILNFGGDAQHYWQAPRELSLQEIMQLIHRGAATGVIYLINYIPSEILQLSFFTGNLLYALMGYWGMLLFWLIAKRFMGDLTEHKDITLFKIPLVLWFWFLPNLHFWSSGIGKDTWLFFAVALFIYSMLQLKKRWLSLILSFVISMSIRPHITLFLLVGFGIAYLVDGRLKLYQKLFIFLMIAVGFGSVFNYVMDFVQLESFETSEIERFTSDRASKLNAADSGSGVDISSYPYPFKMFTFLYRPIFLDANGMLAFMASFENLALLLLTVSALRKGIRNPFKNAPIFLKGILFYFLLGLASFSLILGNLGIMMRQKNMFIPIFGIYLFWVFLYTKQQTKNT